MNSKLFLILFILAIIVYIGSYFYNRSVKIYEYSVTVNYEEHGFREYILDTPTVDEKLESGSHDFGGKSSILIRFYIPIEILEMKIRFKLKHY